MHKIQSEWKNWKRVSGILCDRRISLRVKGALYRIWCGVNRLGDSGLKVV